MIILNNQQSATGVKEVNIAHDATQEQRSSKVYNSNDISYGIHKHQRFESTTISQGRRRRAVRCVRVYAHV